MQTHETPDWRISFREAGERGAPALVFLHGVGGAARGWARQIEHFAGRYHVLAWDMPGYGESAPIEPVTVTGLAAALMRFLEERGAEQPVLVGHSLGGMIVQQVLAAAPGAARAVVLAQTSPAFGSRDGAFQRQFLADRLGPLDAGASMAEIAPGLAAGMVGPGADPAGVALAAECLAGTPDASYRDGMMALIGFDLRAALARIAVPTLVLAGEVDRSAPAAMMERMAGRIVGAQYAVLEGVGHLSYLEAPARFNAALDGFLTG